MNQMALHLTRKVPGLAYASSNLKEHGIWRMPKAKALTMPYIQPNPERVVWCLVFDVDRPGAANAWDDAGLPEPNFISINPKNGHAHLFYVLMEAVTRTDTARQAPLKYLAAIQYTYTEELKADKSYAHLISKNPLHEKWMTTWMHHTMYDMDTLAGYVVLRSPKKREVIGLGRNCTLFDDVRNEAYKSVMAYKSTGRTSTDFLMHLAQHAHAKNKFPASRGGALPDREVTAIARSVSKWTWQRFSQAGFSEWQRGAQKRSAKAKRNKTQAAITDAIKTLQERGESVSMNKVAKLIGKSQSTMSKHHRDLFEGL